MDNIVLPFEWHSFCISIDIDIKKAILFHNGQIQAVQLFEDLEDVTKDTSKYMTSGHLGGAKFVGTLLDFEIFKMPLPEQSLIKWTLCQNQVTYLFKFPHRLIIKNLSKVFT